MVNRARVYTEYVAIALEAERGAARLTVEELSTRSGVPQRTLYRVLHAQRDINVGQVWDIAAVFGLMPSDIFSDAERRMKRASHPVIDSRYLLAHPEADETLTTRLGEARSLPGTSADKLERLMEEIRQTRRDELLSELPPSERAAEG